MNSHGLLWEYVEKNPSDDPVQVKFNIIMVNVNQC